MSVQDKIVEVHITSKEVLWMILQKCTLEMYMVILCAVLSGVLVLVGVSVRFFSILRYLDSLTKNFTGSFDYNNDSVWYCITLHYLSLNPYTTLISHHPTGKIPEAGTFYSSGAAVAYTVQSCAGICCTTQNVYVPLHTEAVSAHASSSRVCFWSANWRTSNNF